MTFRLVAPTIAAMIAVGLAGCAPAEIEPVVVELDDLAGETVQVPIDSSLIILVDWSIVDSYEAVIADESVIEFDRGADTGDMAFAPRITPLELGSTDVTLSSDEDDLDDVTFTVEVVAAG